MLKGILVGAVGTVVLGLIGAYLFVSFGLMPANADAKPSRLERWAAMKSLRAAVDREAPQGPPPIAPTNANLAAGARLYAENCAVCHGASDGKASHIARGLYQHAPQLAKHGVTDDPEGETYWKIDHGIRMTGMPSFAGSLSQNQIWQIALFLKHMDALPPQAERAWKAIASQERD